MTLYDGALKMSMYAELIRLLLHGPPCQFKRSPGEHFNQSSVLSGVSGRKSERMKKMRPHDDKLTTQSTSSHEANSHHGSQQPLGSSTGKP